MLYSYNYDSNTDKPRFTHFKSKQRAEFEKKKNNWNVNPEPPKKLGLNLTGIEPRSKKKKFAVVRYRTQVLSIYMK